MTEPFINKNRTWIRVFADAGRGAKYGFLTQRNFIIHFVISLSVFLLALWLAIPLNQFLILIISITFGLTVEMINTAFEKTVDLVTEEYNEKAKVAKDVSAGAMLLVAFGTAAIGILILLPPLWQKIIG